MDVRDIEFTPGLLARLYVPDGPGPFPAVVDVHGGGWTTGSRLQNAPISEYLAARGILVAALDFRMPPAARYPEPIADINVGIRWFKANAKRFNADPKRIGGLGGSSGGHQLLVAALRSSDPRYSSIPCVDAAGIDSKLAFIVGCWPVADPLVRFHMAQERKNQGLLANHAAYWPDEAAMGEGNPQRIVESGKAESLPPLLLMMGTADENIPLDTIDRFAAAYRAKGGTATVQIYPGEPHTFITKDPTTANSQKAMASIVEFVRSVG